MSILLFIFFVWADHCDEIACPKSVKSILHFMLQKMICTKKYNNYSQIRKIGSCLLIYGASSAMLLIKKSRTNPLLLDNRL